MSITEQLEALVNSAYATTLYMNAVEKLRNELQVLDNVQYESMDRYHKDLALEREFDRIVNA